MTKEGPGFGRLLRDPVVLALLVVHLGVVGLYLLRPWYPQRANEILDFWSMVPISVLGILAPWYGLPAVRRARERLFWGLWSAAFALILAVRIIYIVLPDANSAASGALITDLLYGLFYLVLVVAVLFRPDGRRPLGEQKFLVFLEIAGTFVFTVTLLTYFVFLSRSYSPAEYWTFVPSLTFYWVFDAFLLLSLLYLRHTTTSRRWRILFAWLALAPLLWSITEVLEAIAYSQGLGMRDEPVWNFPAVVDSLWYLPWIAAILASRMRTDPWPSFLGRGAMARYESELVRDFGRPGWLLMAGLTLPIIHLGADLLGILDPRARDLRTGLILASSVLLLAMALLYQALIQKRTRAVARRSQELEERQALLAAAVEQSPDAVLIAGADGMVRYANPAAEAGLSLGRSAIGLHLKEVLPPSLREDESLDASLQRGIPWDGRDRTVGPGGEPQEELISLSPSKDAEGEVFQWVMVRIDVTYLSNLERRLGQAQKMEALGTLAGGIAHDFNNILGAIYGYGELLSMDMDPESPAREDLVGLLNAAERAAELVGQILTFSRQGEEEQKVLLLEPVLREALSLLRATLPSTIEIREDFSGEGAAVMGVRHQIHQMILNLGTNAAHAMGEKGGILTVGLGVVTLEEVQAEKLGLGGGGAYASLRVVDTGQGMDPAVISRIFEPFFTTKEVGRGTGLGLSVVHGSVTSHGGTIWVESEPGEGTCFEILLPVVDSSGWDAVAPPEEPPGGSGEVILVVDDEPVIVTLAQQLLRGLGYEAVAFTSGREALSRFLEDPGAFDAMLTDQTMPGVTGLELARKMKDVRPGFPVILSTGYSETLSQERMEGAGLGQVLMKPYNRRDLGWAVSELLADPPV